MEAAGKRYVLYRPRTAKIKIWNLSDIHWMSKACAEDEVRADIKRIKDDPYSFWLGGGDYCDFIGHSDKRFDPDAVAEWVNVKDLGDLGRVGMTQLRDLFWPIKHKCLGLLIGNHEKKYELKTENDSLHAWLCEELEVPNLQYSAFFDLVLCRGPVKRPRLQMESPSYTSRRQFRVFCHHGAGFATTPGGKLNKLIQFMQSFEADLYFCGHVHDRTARKEPTITVDKNCKKLTHRSRLGVIAGSYLKTYQQGVTTYGEQRGYRPTALGASVVEITPLNEDAMAMV
jgi:hypothetical protein